MSLIRIFLSVTSILPKLWTIDPSTVIFLKDHSFLDTDYMLVRRRKRHKSIFGNRHG